MSGLLLQAVVGSASCASVVHQVLLPALGAAGSAARHALPAGSRWMSADAGAAAEASAPAQAPSDAQPMSAAGLRAVQQAAAAASQQAGQAFALGALTVMAGSYRDVTVSMEALHSLLVQRQHPLRAEPAAAGGTASQPAVPTDPQLSSTMYPLVDVTQLPDNDPSVPQGPQQYDPRYMDRITCWAQTQPNHVETSAMLQTGITLFPPQEASYPTYVDFQAATRLLEWHKSRKRMTLLRRVRRHQDKYQLKTWDHRPGEV